MLSVLFQTLFCLLSKWLIWIFFLSLFVVGNGWIQRFLNPTYSNRNWYDIASCLINTCAIIPPLWSRWYAKLNLMWFIQPVGCQLYSVSCFMSEIWLCASCLLQAGLYVCHFCGKDTFCNQKVICLKINL